MVHGASSHDDVCNFDGNGKQGTGLFDLFDLSLTVCPLPSTANHFPTAYSKKS
jgi:hypothetical protein